MKIKIAGKEIEVINTQTSECLAGYYWVTAYVYAGSTLASFRSGPSHEPPAPLDLLNATRKDSVYDYETPSALTHKGMRWDGVIIDWKNSDGNTHGGTSGGRPAAWIDCEYTIREKIEWALSQIID